MNPPKTYLKEVSEIRSSGVAIKETSYFGPLSAFLNDIGVTLNVKSQDAEYV